MGRSPPRPLRSPPAAQLSLGRAGMSSDALVDTDSAAAQATVSPWPHGPPHHFCSLPPRPATAKSDARADSPTLAGSPSRPPPASTALHQSPSNYFAPELGDENRLPRTSRTTTAIDTPMSARNALDGRPRRHRPASPTNAAPPTRAGRSPFLDSCEPLSPVGVSLHGSSRLYCVPFGRPPRR